MVPWTPLDRFPRRRRKGRQGPSRLPSRTRAPATVPADIVATTTIANTPLLLLLLTTIAAWTKLKAGLIHHKTGYNFKGGYHLGQKMGIWWVS